MISLIKRYPYLILRRIIQFGIIGLFIGSNYLGWSLLSGNYSSAIILGKLHLSDPYAVLQTFFTGFFVGTNALTGALIVAVAYFLLGGRSFCSWVCPMNPVTDFASWLRRKFKLNDHKEININRNLRYWVFGLSLLLSALLGFAAFEMVSPVSILHRGIIFGFGFSWIVIVSIFLFDLGVKSNAWCGHVCPLGAFYAIIGKYSPIRVDHLVENCTNCNDCFIVCPEKQVLNIIGKRSGIIISGECSNCGRCIEACDDNALKFKLRTYNK